MAQWIRRWSTEPEILGSIPSGVVSFRFLPFFFFFFFFGVSLFITLLYEYFIAHISPAA
jgi:hypothetical protein